MFRGCEKRKSTLPRNTREYVCVCASCACSYTYKTANMTASDPITWTSLSIVFGALSFMASSCAWRRLCRTRFVSILFFSSSCSCLKESVDQNNSLSSLMDIHALEVWHLLHSYMYMSQFISIYIHTHVFDTALGNTPQHTATAIVLACCSADAIPLVTRTLQHAAIALPQVCAIQYNSCKSG